MSTPDTPVTKKSGLPFQVRIEPRVAEVPGWLPITISVGAVVVALVLGGVVLALVGGNPFRAYLHIAQASFGSLGVFSDTLVKATPLLLTGLACTVAFRMKLWNIGAEGQLFVGALAASAVVLAPLLPAETPSILMLVTMAAAGFIAGALWGFVPGLLRAKLKVNEVVTTLMMNYIAISLTNFYIYAVWSEGGFQMSRVFPRSAWMPRLADFAEQIPAFRGLTTHLD